MQEHLSSAWIARHPPRVVAQMRNIPNNIDVISFFMSCPFIYERNRYRQSLYHLTLDVNTIRLLVIDAENDGMLKKIFKNISRRREYWRKKSTLSVAGVSVGVY